VTRRIIIDTDPGVDDAMAIFYALASPELDVVGLTTVYGNAHTEVCTHNALALLELAGRSDIPVAAGATGPRVGRFDDPATFVHGRFGQGTVQLPVAVASPDPRDAVTFLIETVLASPGEITLVPIGPLTNIAAAMEREPTFAANLAGIVAMAGNGFCHGNATPAAEANVHNDPEAADIVFGADCEVVMVGLDVTEAIVMGPAELDAMSRIDTERARHLSAITPFYREFHRAYGGLDGIHVHDSTAISYLLAPEAFTWVEQPVRVDTGTGVCRGRTQPAKRVSEREQAWLGRRPVRILTGVDANGVVALELERLART
jgi:purine nucleosidase